MWHVELKFGPIPIWRTDDKDIVDGLKNDLWHRLLRAVASYSVAAPGRAWAQSKLNELERLNEWERDSRKRGQEALNEK